MKKSALLLALLVAGCGAENPVADHGDSDLDSDTWLSDAGILLDAPIPADAEFHATRILVGFRGLDRPATLHAGRVAAEKVRTFDRIPVGVYQLDGSTDVRTAVEELRASGNFMWVEPDYVRTASVSDPFFDYQWHMDAVDASGAWASSTGLGTVVAVIDTGVSAGGTDGIGAFVAGYDFVNGDSDATDDNGHGTHVAGTIAQATDNGVGVVGLAYDAAIMPIKVLDRRGSGYTSDTVAGIDWAVANGADVINMSLGSSYYSAAEAAAVWDAYTAGVFVAAATGNENSSTVSYPAAYSGAVAIGATGFGDYRAPYSNYGSAIDLMAPGGDTSVDLDGDGYADGVLQETFERRSWSYYFFQGTSMATPHAAAAAALLMANGATNVEAEDLLVDTALDLSTSGWDNRTGWGLIQPAAALAAFDGGVDPVDADGDGWFDTEDCDDTDASINPGAFDACGDGIDSDCDGVDPVCTVDADGDGWDDTVDCDDTDASVNPGADEICGDGIDNDCDGVDEVCVIDADGDGWDDTVDCDDTDPAVNPGAVEVCEDGIDNDCDGVDDTCAVGPEITSVSDSTRRSDRTVEWTTDVATTGRVCNDHGDCATTGLGTAHSGTIHKRGSFYTIWATDTDGNTTSVTIGL